MLCFYNFEKQRKSKNHGRNVDLDIIRISHPKLNILQYKSIFLSHFIFTSGRHDISFLMPTLSAFYEHEAIIDITSTYAARQFLPQYHNESLWQRVCSFQVVISSIERGVCITCFLYACNIYCSIRSVYIFLIET